MRKLTFLVALLACIGLAGTAHADECGALDSLDYKRAELVCRKAAEQGDAEAQYYLGFSYHMKDQAEAHKWIRKAAEQGLADAQLLLAGDYRVGLGVTKDYAEAVKWYRKAAEQGRCLSPPNLCRKWAHLYLGVMYEEGQGGMQDFVKAHALFNISVAQGNGAGPVHRDALASKMTTADISRAQQLARECAEKDYKNCGF